MTRSPVTNTFDCDWNLYFNPELKLDQAKFGTNTWAEWQGRGKDVHSRYADPLFVAPEEGDFRLKPESPAFALGFQPYDVKQAGPRIKTGPTTYQSPLINCPRRAGFSKVHVMPYWEALSWSGRSSSFGAGGALSLV